MDKAAFKVILMGDPASKEEFINQVFINTFKEDLKLTIGAGFYFTRVNVKEKEVILRLWDISEDEDFTNLRPSFCKGADGAIFIYDITNPEILEILPEQIKVIRKATGDIPIMLLGNKLNLEDQHVIHKEKLKKLAEKHGFSSFIEISTENRQNVKNVIETMIKLIL